MAEGRSTAQHLRPAGTTPLLSDSIATGLSPSAFSWSVVTCTADGFAHAVPDATLAGVAAGHGRMLAVCGRSIVPGALTSPVGPPCRLCPVDVDDAGEAAVTRHAEVGRRRRRSRFWW